MSTHENTQFIVELCSRDGRSFKEHVRFDTPEDGTSLLDLLPAMYMSAGLDVTERIGLSPKDLKLGFVRKFGETHEFIVDAQYPRDGGPFSDRFRAVDEADAAFQAAQAMAENDAHANGDRGFNYDPIESIAYMKRCVIHSVSPGPSFDELKRALLSFWLAYGSNDPDEIARVKPQVEAVMVKAGILLDPEQENDDDLGEDVEEDDTPTTGMR